MDTVEAMLIMSNTARQALSQGRVLGAVEQGRLSVFLKELHADEVHKMPNIDLQTIERAHLDKLVAAIMASADKSAKPTPDTVTATAIHRLWSSRLKAEYLSLDDKRAHDLVKDGRLRGVSFVAPPSLEFPIHHAWKATQVQSTSEPDPTEDFKTGEWWLNLACAHRDGMVGNEFQKPTTGKWGTLVLPLLSGREELIKDGKVRYIREGESLGDMHVSLMSQTGRQIRILRGYRLHSIYAPQAGCRYDGLWGLASYRQKLDIDTNIYCLELTLERVPNKTSMDELQQIPRPSQLDDWALYERLEMENISRFFGVEGLEQYIRCKKEDVMARDQWREESSSQRPTSFGKSHGSRPGFNPMKLRLPFKVQEKVDRVERESDPRDTNEEERGSMDTVRNLGKPGHDRRASTDTRDTNEEERGSMDTVRNLGKPGHDRRASTDTGDTNEEERGSMDTVRNLGKPGDDRRASTDTDKYFM